MLFGLHLLEKFITCKMRFRLDRGDTFQLCLPFPWPPHKYTQAPTNIFSISITDKKFFSVDSSTAECELSTIENNGVGSEKVTSSWDDRSETIFVYKKPFLTVGRTAIILTYFDTFAAAAAAKSLQSCLTRCDPIDGSPPGSPIPGILQERTLEWVAISFSSAWKWKVKSEREVTQSCPTLCDPMGCRLPDSSIHGIFQARVLEWGAIAFSNEWICCCCWS